MEDRCKVRIRSVYMWYMHNQQIMRKLTAVGMFVFQMRLYQKVSISDPGTLTIAVHIALQNVINSQRVLLLC